MSRGTPNVAARHGTKVLVAVTTAFVLAAVVRLLWPRAELMREKIIVRDPAQLGDVVRVELPLVNRTWRTIRLTGFIRSCGCTDAVDVRGKAIQYPVLVRPGRTFAAMLNVHTSGRPPGMLTVAAGFTTDDDRHPEVYSHVDIDVRAGWCPSATVIRFDNGDQVTNTATVLVGDTLPGSGVEVESVRSTSPRFDVRFVQCEAQTQDQVSIPHWTPRYRVIVKDLGEESKAAPDPYVWIYRKDGKDPMRLAIVPPPTARGIKGKTVAVFLPTLKEGETCSRLVRLPGLAKMDSIVVDPGPILVSVEELLKTEHDALVRLVFRGPLSQNGTPTELIARGSRGTSEQRVALAVNISP